MPRRISPMFAVNDGDAAIDFYKRAFGATVSGVWVAGMSSRDCWSTERASFWRTNPRHMARAPQSAGFTTVRIELFVDDPVAVHKRALAAGATNHSPVEEHEHATTGPKPIKRMLQGVVLDPSGHTWLSGRFLK
jgi:uncharacterized glyoxalase superfamily protein PhnB